MSSDKNNTEKFLSPFMSWDIYAMDLYEIKLAAKRKHDLGMLIEMRQKYHWQIELESLFKNPYEAIVVTDAQQIIQWVNEGFVKMTGYPANHALGKKPSFLQGKNTSEETKYSIRQKLLKNASFSTDIINYRKNGEEYLCHVEIHPLCNGNEKPTHFLALESEVQA